MKIKQFEDAPLAHYSYAILSKQKVIVIDPARNPLPYYQFAEENDAEIIAVLETHPHADFVSSHLQIHQETGATIYVSKMVGAEYPHQAFDEGNQFEFGNATVKAIHTPGHSPDGISFYVTDKNSNSKALFTGDTLFIGDVGRPDLREKAGNMKAKRQELAEAMYKTVQEKFTDLADDVLIYPAHGAGSLCGKNMSDAASSTLGNERTGNWAFQDQTQEEFVNEILKDQPFIPSYFGFNVDINKKGAANFQQSTNGIPLKLYTNTIEKQLPIVDVRDEADFKNGHFEGSFNIMARSESDKIETWLGAIIQPEEQFYVVVKSVSDIESILSRIAKIGYEKQIEAVLTIGREAKLVSTEVLDVEEFKANKEQYHIIDIRSKSEHQNEVKFESSDNHPLNDLRKSAEEIKPNKHVVVHCAGGYRSAAGASILEAKLKGSKVYDLSSAIEDF
ncbi:MBL fold metallo-hydrolase [Psychroflexus planctonicus]|uniref:MBL fold metallo-hydrolase n=1 Tax=Psychroflexus planctonicus TaxID=1526575 RepID=A0ABQ1SFU6_9FLAO|nr:MBL fold metallo-hydrolase [Psychroflexus planctonicus]GGE30408.1 MBL fold metallo-hydrolase [Psychroflexus planctonicus]